MVPKRAPSKVELPSKYRYQRRSFRIRNRVGAAAKDPDFVQETVNLSKGESDKSSDPVTPPVATAKSPPKATAKEKKKVAPKPKGKKPEKKAQTKKSPKRTPATSFSVKGSKFSDSKSKTMMTYVVKCKIISERLIKLKDFEKAGTVQLLKDRELFDSVCIAKPYSPALVREFYANLKK